MSVNLKTVESINRDGSGVQVGGMQGYADDGTDVYERPNPQNRGREFPMAESTIKGDVHEGMNGNGHGEHATCQVTGAHEPALGKAGVGLDSDGIAAQPEDVEEEGKRLLDVGQDQVEDEDDELVDAEMGLSPSG